MSQKSISLESTLFQLPNYMLALSGMYYSSWDCKKKIGFRGISPGFNSKRGMNVGEIVPRDK